MPQGNTFAERLTSLMLERRMTVRQLHEELGGVISDRSIKRWRSGEAVPGAEALPILARALETSPNALVGWEDTNA